MRGQRPAKESGPEHTERRPVARHLGELPEQNTCEMWGRDMEILGKDMLSLEGLNFEHF
jgi:hypothetical protein